MDMSKEQNFVSAVVYVHNSGEVIYQFLIQLADVLQSNFSHYEIICVNDFSADNSYEEIQRYSESVPDAAVTVVQMSFYQAIDQAMSAGVDLAIGDFVYEFDTVQLDYDPDFITDVYFQSLKGFDIVGLSPGLSKRFTSKIFYKLFNNNAGLQYDLYPETFRILSRRAINKVHSMSEKIPYRKAMYANCGLKVAYLFYQPTEPIKRASTSRSASFDLALDSLILFTNLFYKISLFLTLVMMLMTIGTAVYTVWFFTRNVPIEGWTTTMLFMTAAFFGLFLMVSILIKYLSLLVNLIFVRQKYAVATIEKMNGQ